VEAFFLKFSIAPSGETTDRKKVMGCTNGTDRLYRQAKYGGDRGSRAGCRRKSMIFFVCLSRFGIICPKGVYLLKRFLQNLAWEKESQVCILVPNFTVVALKCGLTAPKIANKWQFWYKFAPKGKFWGSTEKLEYRCTTTNLPG